MLLFIHLDKHLTSPLIDLALFIRLENKFVELFYKILRNYNNYNNKLTTDTYFLIFATCVDFLTNFSTLFQEKIKKVCGLAPLKSLEKSY